MPSHPFFRCNSFFFTDAQGGLLIGRNQMRPHFYVVMPIAAISLFSMPSTYLRQKEVRCLTPPDQSCGLWARGFHSNGWQVVHIALTFLFFKFIFAICYLSDCSCICELWGKQIAKDKQCGWDWQASF